MKCNRSTRHIEFFPYAIFIQKDTAFYSYHEVHIVGCLVITLECLNYISSPFWSRVIFIQLIIFITCRLTPWKDTIVSGFTAINYHLGDVISSCHIYLASTIFVCLVPTDLFWSFLWTWLTYLITFALFLTSFDNSNHTKKRAKTKQIEDTVFKEDLNHFCVYNLIQLMHYYMKSWIFLWVMLMLMRTFHHNNWNVAMLKWCNSFVCEFSHHNDSI